MNRDTWGGEYNNPITLNRWGYANANPLRYVDPSGNIYETEAQGAWDIVMNLKRYQVNIVVDWGYYENGLIRSFLPVPPDLAYLYGWGCLTWEVGEWDIDELKMVQNGVEELSRAMGSQGNFIKNLGGVSVVQNDTTAQGHGDAHLVRLSVDSFSPWTVVHELAHAWDRYKNRDLSNELVRRTGGFVDKALSRGKMSLGICDVVWNSNTRQFEEGSGPGQHGRIRGCNANGYFYGDMPSGADWNFNPKEDFAESVAMYVGWDSSNQFLYNRAQGRIDRFTQANGSIDIYGVRDNWADYSKYFYPSGGDYTKTMRWEFIDNIMNKMKAVL